MTAASILKWSHLDEFIKIIETNDLHGLSFQHSELCDRRAWLHLHRIDYAHLDERMHLGQALHDGSKARDNSIVGLFGLSPDRIDWINHVVYEAKGGAGARHAIALQTAFYAVILSKATNTEWTAANDLLKQKRLRPVPIDAELLEDLISAARKLDRIRTEVIPPSVSPIALCPSCSYTELCWPK